MRCSCPGAGAGGRPPLMRQEVCGEVTQLPSLQQGAILTLFHVVVPMEASSSPHLGFLPAVSSTPTPHAASWDHLPRERLAPSSCHVALILALVWPWASCFINLPEFLRPHQSKRDTTEPVSEGRRG